MITKHSYSSDTFNKLFSSFAPQEKKENQKSEQLVKVASGCVDCPYSGNVSASVCNTCRFASGISYSNGSAYIKCSYSDNSKMVKEASTVQGVHWDSGVLPQKEAFENVRNDMKNNVIEELRFAARKIGIDLAQGHLDDFSKMAMKERLTGKKLEQAARTFVTKIEERVVPAQRRGKNDVFTLADKNPKTIMSSTSSPTVGDNDSAGCGYLGSKTNPNTIWNSDLLKKAAQTPSSDEITKKLKKEQADSKEKIKEAYWKALGDKLSDKTLVSSSRVHSTSTQEEQAFNSKLPSNSMGIFGEHKEFENIPDKTAGETIAEQNEERSSKKSKENKEVSIKAAKTSESSNWLFT